MLFVVNVKKKSSASRNETRVVGKAKERVKDELVLTTRKKERRRKEGVAIRGI